MPGLMEIRIGIDPNIVEVGGRVLTWHGFLTFVAVASAVFIIARWARQEGISTDAVYSVAVWAIIGGIIGSRLLHVVDLWSEIYGPSPERIVYVWQGGITIYGAILGGFASGAAYMAFHRQASGYRGAWPAYRHDGWQVGRRHQRRAFLRHYQPALGLCLYPPRYSAAIHEQLLVYHCVSAPGGGV